MNETADSGTMRDEFQIARLLQNWGTWRDAGDWDNLRECYTPDASMVTTWHDGPAAGFIEHSIRARAEQAKDRGGHHVIGGTTIQIKGDRALAQTRITLLLRSEVEGTLVDVTVYGRFFDRLKKTEGRWRIQQRVPVYDKDCMQAVDPGKLVHLDAARLAMFPTGFRHLAYVQASGGAQITTTIPEANSEAEKQLSTRAQAWLQGA